MKNNGFTLLEILIAISILAIMSAMSFSSLSILIDNTHKIQNIEERWQMLANAMTIIERDLEQAIPRKIRTYSNQLRDVIEFNSADTKLDFTILTRLSLFKPFTVSQRITYIINQGYLEKWSWTPADQPNEQPGTKKRLLSQVENIHFEKIAPTLISNNDDDKSDPNWPRAIKVKITLKDLGEFERIVLLNEN